MGKEDRIKELKDEIKRLNEELKLLKKENDNVYFGDVKYEKHYYSSDRDPEYRIMVKVYPNKEDKRLTSQEPRYVTIIKPNDMETMEKELDSVIHQLQGLYSSLFIKSSEEE